MTTHTAVVGLSYGDEAKGAVVDRLCARTGDDKPTAVVRYNGGAQAAHNVLTDDGRHHTFAQFGAGSFHGVPTFLSEYMIVEPLSLMIEGRVLEQKGVNAFDLLSVDRSAFVTTPYHWLLNRWREDQLGDGRHGSTGRGVGATVEHSLLRPDDALRVKDIFSPDLALAKLHGIRSWVSSVCSNLIPLPAPSDVLQDYTDFRRTVRVTDLEKLANYARQGPLVFEGAQGVLLDEHVGFHPHTTWSTVTPDNARTLTNSLGDDLEIMGVVRAYSTRHGAGPFVPEDNTLNLPETHNKREHYQGSWRIGHFDTPAVRYAIRACGGVDSLYVTHADTAEHEPRLKMCVDYLVDGVPYDLRFYPKDAFARRTLQTQLLAFAKPYLVNHPRDTWWNSIADTLQLPLAGFGVGPHTSSGHFKESVNA